MDKCIALICLRVQVSERTRSDLSNPVRFIALYERWENIGEEVTAGNVAMTIACHFNFCCIVSLHLPWDLIPTEGSQGKCSKRFARFTCGESLSGETKYL